MTRKTNLIIMAITLLLSFSAHAAKYSVLSINDVHYGNLPGIRQYLDKAKALGLNTIAINVTPHDIDRSAADYMALGGYLSTTDTWRRDHYKLLYKEVLSHSGNFNLIVQINCQAQNMANIGPGYELRWQNNNFFLKHRDASQRSSVVVDGIQETWVPSIDFYVENMRQRILDFKNPTVMAATKVVFQAIIRDVVVEAKKISGANARVFNFSVNTTPTGESEYWFNFFTGNNSSGGYNTNFDLANSSSTRITWFDSWHTQMADMHKELSNLVKSEKSTAGTGFTFNYGTHLSSAYDVSGLRRGTSNLSKIAAALNPGDIFGNADVPEIWDPNSNSAFSMDYYTSIASWKSLKTANEFSPIHMLEGMGFSASSIAASFTTQLNKSYNHGADIFFISNWSLANLNNATYEPVAKKVAELFKSSDTRTFARINPILVDAWALYSKETQSTDKGLENVLINGGWNTVIKGNNGQVPHLYSSLSSRYNYLSNNGSNCIRFFTSHMLASSPTIMSSTHRSIWVPAMNRVITESAKTQLIKKVNLSRLRLESLDAGSLNEYQQPRASLAQYKAADLLWLDRNNIKLQVATSSCYGFNVATTWKSYSATDPMFTGDFNGDGLNDVLFISSGSSLSVGLSNGSNAFSNPALWRRWTGINPADVRIGDFNGDGKDDVLWIDRYNATSPGLRVSLANATTDGFATPTLWRSWSGLATSFGFYVGDFDGNGYDDFLNFANNYELQVARSNKSTGFFSALNWGGWGADAADLRVGDFNGDGRDDLLWVDKANKFPGDVSPDYPGLLVTTSTGSDFPPATLWSGWGGLTTSRGFYTGDFNGDGLDDFLNFASNYELQVVVSNGIANFSGLQVWGGWGANAADLRVGNFNKPITALPKQPAPEPIIADNTQQTVSPVVFANGDLKIDLSGTELQSNPVLSIFDVSGKLIGKIALSIDTKTVIRDVVKKFRIPAGTYVIRLTSGSRPIFSGKAVLQ